MFSCVTAVFFFVSSIIRRAACCLPLSEPQVFPPFLKEGFLVVERKNHLHAAPTDCLSLAFWQELSPHATLIASFLSQRALRQHRFLLYQGYVCN